LKFTSVIVQYLISSQRTQRSQRKWNPSPFAILMHSARRQTATPFHPGRVANQPR
jgi:hypothetical protein